MHADGLGKEKWRNAHRMLINSPSFMVSIVTNYCQNCHHCQRCQREAGGMTVVHIPQKLLYIFYGTHNNGQQLPLRSLLTHDNQRLPAQIPVRI
jgi:hypothetical protein